MRWESLFESGQSNRPLRLHFTGNDAAHRGLLIPYRLHYSAALSCPYTARLECFGPNHGIRLAQLLGQPVRITLQHDAGVRVVNGHVRQVRRTGTDGGLAGYCLGISPALHLLSLRRTSRIFQDMAVPDIVAQILQEHAQRNPTLASMLHVTSRLYKAHPVRSCCTQFDETDLDFIHRLLAEEGIHYVLRFGTGEGMPAESMLLFDDAQDLERAAPGSLRYRCTDDGSATGDTLLSWQPERQLVSTATTLRSHDYKAGGVAESGDVSAVTPGTAAAGLGVTLEDYSVLAPYYTSSQAELDQQAQLRQCWQDQRSKTWYGCARTVGPEIGQYIEVGGHPALEGRDASAREFVLLSECLQFTNNLPHDGLAGVPAALLALAETPVGPHPDPAAPSLRFSAVRRGIVLVPDRMADLRRPTVHGPQTATVVGRAGETIDTDALGRILVQMHWPRDLEHPRGGADVDQRSSTRIRCAAPSAGDGFGHQFLPRIGDEVLVVFLHGDIDRPVVVASLYGGRRPPPAFSAEGDLPGNRSLSGIQTREHNGDHAGELLFDDSPGQPRARLATTYQASELNLGYLTHPRRSGHADPRGEGAELRTDGAAALRAARGLLLTTQAQPGAGGSLLQRDSLIQSVQIAHALVKSLSEAAQDQSLTPADDRALEGLLQALRGWEAGSNRQPDGDAGGAPLAAVHADAGLVVSTPQSALINSNAVLALAADAMQQSARRSWRVHAGEAMDLFVQSAKRAVTALRMVAARGDVDIAAHDGRLHASASDQIHIDAGAAVHITVANGPVRIVGGSGCLLQMEGGNIDLHCPGTFTVKASVVDMDDGAHASVQQNHWPQTDFNERFQARYDTGEPARHCRYELIRADGARLHGTADADGMIELQQGLTLEDVTVRLLPTAQEPTP